MKDNGEAKAVLLAVLAHPDDETFGMGGTLAYYARRNVSTHVICATRGEAGDVDEEYLKGYHSVAERREAELRCAAGKLGLAGVYFLGWRDSGMPGSADNQHPQALIQQPLEQVAAQIATYIRRLKPDVLITFDPIGGYRHPDHIFIHQATVKAFGLAADENWQDADNLPPHRPAKFYFQTIPRGFLRLIVRLLRIFGKDPRKYGRNHDIDLVAISEVDFPTHAVINYRSVADIRDEASRCHASQGGGSLTGGLFAPLRRIFASKELYMRYYPEPKNGRVERDLFEGIVQLPPFKRDG